MPANVDVAPSSPPSSGLTHLESPDGRSFVARGPAHEQPVPGDYLELEGEDGVLAFVEDVTSEASGTGFSASGTLVQVGGAGGHLGPVAPCGLAVARRAGAAHPARRGPAPAVRGRP
ncbi:hypothetical protein GCM10009868_38360 [Terrabacter aerolatus]|uniref:Uncharacterized protein n=1 Tax=Terrabacter aerolatus TaxID=422442 RepID=A0A512D0Q1_9MICO|nr:hypothetical protein [Terrabacter aerolatus]GEO30031.1 hypothetical protein TAE01_18410 [Terrabacter aerolatus]